MWHIYTSMNKHFCTKLWFCNKFLFITGFILYLLWFFFFTRSSYGKRFRQTCIIIELVTLSTTVTRSVLGKEAWPLCLTVLLKGVWPLAPQHHPPLPCVEQFMSMFKSVPSVFPAVWRCPAGCSERHSECVHPADPEHSSGAARDTHAAADQAPTHANTQVRSLKTVTAKYVHQLANNKNLFC